MSKTICIEYDSLEYDKNTDKNEHKQEIHLGENIDDTSDKDNHANSFFYEIRESLNPSLFSCSNYRYKPPSS